MVVGRLTIDELIDLFAVVGGDVGDVGFVFETAFDLEGRDAGLDEFSEVGTAIEILEREGVLLCKGLSVVVAEQLHIGIKEVVRQAAELGTAAAIG